MGAKFRDKSSKASTSNFHGSSGQPKDGVHEVDYIIL